MVKNNLNKHTQCLAETLTKQRTGHRKNAEEDVGEITSNSEGGKISWETLVLRRDPNEQCTAGKVMGDLLQA